MASSLPEADETDSIGEACGVFGIWGPGLPTSHLTYLALYALQHRGQESAGIAVTDGVQMCVDKGMGLVPAIFNEHRLAALTGHVAIGHTRYSTTGSSTWRNAQPVFRGSRLTQFALAHNGNLINTRELLELTNMTAEDVGSDSDVVAELLARELAAHVATDSDPHAFEKALLTTLPQLRGAFSFVMLAGDRLIGVRDPNGFRPLFLGRLDDGWVLASETPALDVIGATVVREVAPGEVIFIDGDGVYSEWPFADERIDPRLCIFEFVYFARPDGELRGESIQLARQRMGEQLAREAPADADLVVPIPDSSIPGAQGYARQSGIPYGDGFVKNRYIGRTFIAPSQELREAAVRIKLNPIKRVVEGKRLVVIDDSIVRATTLRETVRMVRKAGAAEVHLRILSPPYRWPCFFGMDTADRSKLIAANLSVDDIREYLGADSLSYLSLDGLRGSMAPPRKGFCDACLTGRYPIELPSELLAATDLGADPSGLPTSGATAIRR
ncbi:amidophosphoribosyltransferase [Micromonospora pisi]|uniref:amidophosphoribosyltransferase n=1 Tax=Micromonospora pisi TaxID=589240 RepID=UPI001FE4E7A8|nr:amidophosphoribosyltransferase [Micromonospora pisi]